MAAATMSGAWSYAVPLDEVDGNARPAMSRRGTGSSAEHGAAKQLARKNSAWDLQSDSEETRQRRTSVRQSHTQASRKRSRNTLRSDDDPDSPRLDDSKWIHRDKLAQIEIKEMREAGIMVAPQRRSLSAGAARSRSRSRSRGYKPTGQELDDEYAAAYPYDDSPRRRRMSPVFSDDGQPAPELQQPSRYNHQGDGNERSPQKPLPARPGTSRIPVPRTSPMPLSGSANDRTPSDQRNRSDSQSLGGSREQHNRKMRTYSAGSQAMLGNSSGSQGTPPGSDNKNSSTDEGSPERKRTQKKGPTARKASAASTLAARPGSRAGLAATNSKRTSPTHRSRPSTGHMPEGEAPWIASMYKPDPRLPPDQQMIPTHAKRMMQEQWEKEGKTGTAYDRDLRLLNDDELQQPKTPVLPVPQRENSPSPRKNQSPPKLSLTPNLSNGNGWGNGPLSPAKSESGSARPPTSGGYRITPNITTPPPMMRTTTMTSTAPTDRLNKPVPRLPEMDEKNEAKQKKGCCCVVM